MYGFACLFGRAWLALVGFSLLVASSLNPAAAQLLTIETENYSAKPAVYLMTIAPGTLYWERFGHNAIIIDPAPDQNAPFSLSVRAISYNFGYFDMTEAGFLPNFIRGRMSYSGVQIPAIDDIVYYQAQNRGIWLQKLNLDESAQQLLRQRLIFETSKPNERYQYDYFRQNCSTKLRDALNAAFDGELEKSVQGRATGQTFRSLGLAQAQGELWLYLGIHAGLGPSTDRPLSFYEEYFIPGKLMRGIADKSIKGEPIVLATQILKPDMPISPWQPDWRYFFGIAGLLIGVLIASAARLGVNRITKLLPAGLCALAIGTFGALLLFLQLTDHQDSHWNLNLFLFNPLWLAAAPGAGRILSKTNVRRLLNLALGIAVFGAAIKVFPWIRQQNIEWVLLLLPIHYAIWFSMSEIAVETKVLPSDA